MNYELIAVLVVGAFIIGCIVAPRKERFQL